MQNPRVLLASRPAGWVSEDNFRLEIAPVPQPKDGEVLVKNLWLSLDPYMRGRMSDAKSYVKGVELGEVMVGQTVGEVLESKHPTIKKGDTVLTQLGWQLFGATKEAVKLEAGKAPLFDSLKGQVLGECGTESNGGLADRLKMSEGALRVAAHRLRERYLKLLRAEVANTVATPDDVDQELRHLITALRE